MSKKIILIAGPTASGKSKLAIHLAKKINGEIINADSMQIYKEISILTSRPNHKDTKIIKHHLYVWSSADCNIDFVYIYSVYILPHFYIYILFC